MFKNYLKIAFRNLWKNKVYNIINIIGMALGLTAFLLILLYVNYERSYDKIFPSHQHVVKAGISAPGQKQNGSTMSAGFGPQAAQQFPEIKNYTRVNFFISKTLWSAEHKNNYVDNLYSVDSTFFDIFKYTFLYGDPKHALDKPNSMVISDKISHEFFGNKNPVGETIQLNKKNDYTITGVFKPFEGPTTFHPNAFKKLDTRGRETSLFPMNYYTFFRIRTDENTSSLSKKLTTFLRRWSNKINPAADFEATKITLDPISEMHFSDIAGSEAGHPALLTMLLVIGIILLLIASVNFINLSVASAMGRAKEVGMRKVMGAGKNRLKLQFYFEIFLQVLLAFLLANIFVELLKPAYAHFLGLDALRNASGSWEMALYCIATLFLVTLIAGAYPAFYLSHFDPSKVLKGSFARGKSGTFTQRLLLISQITLTTIFLVGVMIMAKQVKYLKNINLGLQPGQVLAIPLHTNEAYKSYNSLKIELEHIPGIQSVSRIDNLPGGGFGGNDYQYRNVKRSFSYLCVDYDFVKTMGMEIISGRRFNPQRDPDTLGHIILNQTAVKALGITGNPVGQYLTRNPGGMKDKVIGVVKDFHYDNLQKRIYPLVFQLHQGNWMRYVLIRMNTKHLDQTLANIKTIWNRYEPGFPVTYTFLDSYFAKFLKSFQRQEKTVFVFALLAVLLSLFGLFALVAFSIRRRTKEMAVRKVLGASNKSLLKLLNKNFVWIAIIGNIIGWPLAYLAARHWLNGFAYRISMPVWPFVIATALSIVLTILTVSVQAWRAARANPVEALKYE